jgi:metal-dependent amidase/aminoacylase/carboxypeptidase family protein
MPLLNRAAELQTDVTEWRRALHRKPELLFDVHETADFVAERLRAFGCDEVVTGLGRTGVVGVIRGRRGPGRTIGLRADMDALPITEASGKPWASATPGRMHACGHDGHTAMLLGAARYLSETRNFAGSVALIFQPAEEGGGGGNEMVKDGMMDRFGIAEVYGMHNLPGLAVGAFATRKGPIMAATDEFTRDRCAGAAATRRMPHETIDPIVIGRSDDRRAADDRPRAMQARSRSLARRLRHARSRPALPTMSFPRMRSCSRAPCARSRKRTAMRGEAEARIRQICEGLAGAHGAEPARSGTTATIP